MLLERLRAARLHHQRRFDDLDGLVRGSVGLHSTDYGSPYLSAWARLDGFDPADLFARLNTGRGLVRLNCLRNTVHVVHVADLPLIAAATGPAVFNVGRRSPGLARLADTEVRAGIDALCAALADGPLANNDLKAAVPALAADLRYWLLAAMGTGEVIRADAAHARSNRTRYALTRRWVPGWAPFPDGAAEARRRLLARAVETFGPVTEADLAWWLPAPKGEVKRALASLGAEVAHVDQDGERYWFPAALADAAPPPRDAHGAWLLPYEDALLKGYQDRGWCLAPGLKDVLFPFDVKHWHPPDGVAPGPGPHKGVNVSGEARPSVWWAGRAVGRWEQRDADVVWQLHADVGAEGKARLAEAIDGLRRFVAEGLGPIS